MTATPEINGDEKRLYWRKRYTYTHTNPSHLECVNPVVVGKVHTKQCYCGNCPDDMCNGVPILLHGDTAFTEQGVVYETMQLAKVDIRMHGLIRKNKVLSVIMEKTTINKAWKWPYNPSSH
eukprot:8458662-Ditylum_brightwellii.AAC.1